MLEPDVYARLVRANSPAYTRMNNVDAGRQRLTSTLIAVRIFTRTILITLQKINISWYF